jgi:hypothetical protein
LRRIPLLHAAAAARLAEAVIASKPSVRHGIVLLAYASPLSRAKSVCFGIDIAFEVAHRDHGPADRVQLSVSPGSARTDLN